jgi:hypothetical protein
MHAPALNEAVISEVLLRAPVAAALQRIQGETGSTLWAMCAFGSQMRWLATTVSRLNVAAAVVRRPGFADCAFDAADLVPATVGFLALMLIIAALFLIVWLFDVMGLCACWFRRPGCVRQGARLSIKRRTGLLMCRGSCVRFCRCLPAPRPCVCLHCRHADCIDCDYDADNGDGNDNGRTE